MLTTAVSVASFSAVTAHAFASIGMSTIVPNTFALMAAVARQNADTAEGDIDDLLGRIKQAFPNVGDGPFEAGAEIAKTIAKQGKNIRKLDLLIPKTAHLEAEFEFSGREEYAADVSLGAKVEVVTVNAGYSALYEAASRNKVKFEVDYVTVEIPLSDAQPDD